MQRKSFSLSRVLPLGIFLAVVAVSAAAAPTAVSVGLSPGANCTTNSNLLVSWTMAGNPHTEFGAITNTAGATIGGFGPNGGNPNDNFTGTYGQPISTAQAPGTLLLSYAWVGVNPPTAAGSIEFSVLYNCSSKQVLYSCFGAFGKCANTAAAALATTAIPTTSPEAIAVMILLLAVLGAFFLRRKASAVR